MRGRVRWCEVLGVAALVMTPLAARGQGFIVDRMRPRPIARSYEVRDVSIDARVRDQVAEVQVSQTFHNPGSVQIEAEFLFPLPEDGAVQNFVLLVDGRELTGRLMPKDEARRIYEEIVRSSRDPALLEYNGRGLYKTSVFPIPPGADRKVTMRYTQVCKRDRDVVEFSYPLGTQKFTAKPVQRLSVSLRIESRDAIKSLYCPTDDARVERSGDHEARVTLERRDVIPANDFRLIATLAEGSIGASVLSVRPSSGEDGYFLLLASPEVKANAGRSVPKTVVFVLDRSGSMAGKKIEQARNALKFVLNNLRDDDTFNVVAYDDRIESFRPELQRYSRETREQAGRYVENIREGGATNIDGALTAALEMVRGVDRPTYILFLTDGLPTAGETGEIAIAKHAKEANRSRARVFSFGVGFDVNARLLDRVSGGNGGTSEYVKPDDDIETHVARFYSKMTSPVLADVRVEFDGTDVNRTYPRDVPDLFEGGQLVLAGRYTRPGKGALRVSGRVNGERKSYEFPVELADSGRGSSHDFVETLWATRRVGDLIDQIDLHGQTRELVDELVALSTRYGLLTPYTSFLADERVQLHARAENASSARLRLEELQKVTGLSAVSQRGAKRDYMSADRAPAQTAAGGFGGYASAPAGPAATGASLAKTKTGTPALGRAMPGMMGMAADGAVSKDAYGRVPAPSVRRVGAKTFFLKAGRWVDSSVKAEDEAKALSMTLFSDAFFKLAASLKPEFGPYLTFGEPVTVELDGKVYKFDPPKP